MKKLTILFLATVLLLFSCKKNENAVSWKPPAPQQQNEMKCYPTSLSAEIVAKLQQERLSKNGRAETGGTAQCMFLDFDGETVTPSEGGWYGSNIYAQPSSFTTAASQDSIVNLVRECYAVFGPLAFNPTLIITRDSTKYWNAPVNKRTRCIITRQTSPTVQTLFGSYINGKAHYGSDTTAVDDVCWVFDSALSVITSSPPSAPSRWVGLYVSHEFGHTFNLHHQSQWPPNTCAQPPYYEYRPATITGGYLDDYVPIMGQTEGNVAINTFTEGIDDVSCTHSVNEWSVLNHFIPIQADGNDNTFANAYVLTKGTGVGGTLETSTDADMYKITGTPFSWNFIQVTPSLNSPLTWGCVDIAVDVYNSSQQLIAILNPDDELDIPKQRIGTIGSTLYFSVRNTTTNVNIPANSVKGWYVITVTGG